MIILHGDLSLMNILTRYRKFRTTFKTPRGNLPSDRARKNRELIWRWYEISSPLDRKDNFCEIRFVKYTVVSYPRWSSSYSHRALIFVLRLLSGLVEIVEITYGLITSTFSKVVWNKLKTRREGRRNNSKLGLLTSYSRVIKQAVVDNCFSVLLFRIRV